MNIAIVNGPNLNMLGLREPNLYGKNTLDAINDDLKKNFSGRANLHFFQSNHEGEIIDHLQGLKGIGGIVINPGAFTHTSVAIRDALLTIKLPLIEVHLSNIFAREEFRKVSFFSDIAIGVITGLGELGYRFAIETLIAKSSS